MLLATRRRWRRKRAGPRTYDHCDRPSGDGYEIDGDGELYQEDYAGSWPGRQPTTWKDQVRTRHVCKNRKTQLAYIKHAREFACLDVMRAEADRRGLPDREGDAITLVAGRDSLMDLWGVKKSNIVGDVLDWLESHGWIQCGRHVRKDGTSGKRNGTYVLGRVNRRRWTGTDGVGRQSKYTSWLKGTVLSKTEAEGKS